MKTATLFKTSLLLFGTLSFSVAFEPGPEHHQLIASQFVFEHSERKVASDQLLDYNNRLQNAVSSSQYTSGYALNIVKDIGAECNHLRTQAFELRKRIEALGVDGFGANIIKTQQALLVSVADLQLLDIDRKRLVLALGRLCNAVKCFSKHASTLDPEARLALEIESRDAHTILDISSQLVTKAGSLELSDEPPFVVSVKDDLAMVVTNYGIQEGAKVGMLLRILREEKVIAFARVVDVRDNISGAVIQDLTSNLDHIQVGDKILLFTQQ